MSNQSIENSRAEESSAADINGAEAPCSGVSPHRTPSHEEIAVLAFEYFLSRGVAAGNELEDWLRAERELTESRDGVHASEEQLKRGVA